jgi:hypothetical protein
MCYFVFSAVDTFVNSAQDPVNSLLILFSIDNMTNATLDHTLLVRGFVPEPDGRGMLSIIWSGLAVLFLNT